MSDVEVWEDDSVNWKKYVPPVLPETVWWNADFSICNLVAQAVTHVRDHGGYPESWTAQAWHRHLTNMIEALTAYADMQTQESPAWENQDKLRERAQLALHHVANNLGLMWS